VERIVADRYELERLLGTGGMSEVWCAADRRLGRRVALERSAVDRHQTWSERAKKDDAGRHGWAPHADARAMIARATKAASPGHGEVSAYHRDAAAGVG